MTATNLNLALNPIYTGGAVPPSPAEYSYSYVIAVNNIITQISPSSNFSTLAPGTYTVCGLSYLTTAASQINSLIGMNVTVVLPLV